MKKSALWSTFCGLQLLGCFCALAGGEAFAITKLGFEARIIGLIVLEPGLILMEGIIEKAFWGSHLRLEAMFRLGLLLAVVLNSALFALILRFFDGRKSRSKMLRQ